MQISDITKQHGTVYCCLLLIKQTVGYAEILKEEAQVPPDGVVAVAFISIYSSEPVVERVRE